MEREKWVFSHRVPDFFGGPDWLVWERVSDGVTYPQSVVDLGWPDVRRNFNRKVS